MTSRSEHPSSPSSGHIDPKEPLLRGFIRGMLPLYVLMILEVRSLHGTEILRAFDEMSGGRWRPSPGSLYPALRRLETEGLLAGRWRRSQAAPQRVYRLTDKGRQELPRRQLQLLSQLRDARALLDEHIEALERLDIEEKKSGGAS